MNKQEDHKQIINQLSTFKTVKPAFSFKESLYREILSFEKEPKTPHIFVPFYNLRFAVIAVIVFLFSATGIAVASQNAPYGSFLYPVKHIVLSTRLSLAKDSGTKALLNMEKAEDQLMIIKDSVAKGDEKVTEDALNEYNQTVEKVLRETKSFAGETNSTVETIADTLGKQGRVLEEIKNEAPNNIHPAFNNAIDTSQKLNQVQGVSDEMPVSNQEKANSRPDAVNPQTNPSPEAGTKNQETQNSDSNDQKNTKFMKNQEGGE